MGFWLFMLAAVLLVPLVMLGFGTRFLRHPPKRINGVYGYRTTRSMKNQDTWTFAHRTCGRLWRMLGLILLLLSLAVMLPLAGRPEGLVGLWGIVLEGVQLAVLIGSLFPVEAALKRTFDDSGLRKKPAPRE